MTSADGHPKKTTQEYRRQYRLANRERINAYQREYMKEYYHRVVKPVKAATFGPRRGRGPGRNNFSEEERIERNRAAQRRYYRRKKAKAAAEKKATVSAL